MEVVIGAAQLHVTGGSWQHKAVHASLHAEHMALSIAYHDALLRDVQAARNMCSTAQISAPLTHIEVHFCSLQYTT
jgi:hypothetical protein